MATDFWITLPGEKYDSELGWPCSALGIPSAEIEEFRLGGKTLPLEQVKGDKHHLRLVILPDAQRVPDAAAKIRLSKRLVTFEASIVIALVGLLGTLGSAYYGYRKTVEERMPGPAETALRAENLDLKKRLTKAEAAVALPQRDTQSRTTGKPISKWQEFKGFNNLTGLWRGESADGVKFEIEVLPQDGDHVAATFSADRLNCRLVTRLAKATDDQLSTSNYFFKPGTATAGCPDVESLMLRPLETFSDFRMTYTNGKTWSVRIFKKI